VLNWLTLTPIVLAASAAWLILHMGAVAALYAGIVWSHRQKGAGGGHSAGIL
jgi:hypothetical protein